ncbi:MULTISPECIES: SAM-dependent methyltransferase [unclassified Salinivibrio]|uniref:SAM-dependent methyltransferase n=1 Tax=unclassified Salinivibrio TaxID=2636825 RepID=UPI0009856B3B|nr:MULTISPECIES: cyclopropane-fatty-acyl-phospholipid synthase family protein [unclassified Salinivibrio]OOF10901.1 SAM-dependent methyltransferase [Salinivibrio sp. PR919]OOF17806.1 SAM-dependent methyltransferase [Salinivibrio sp. PR932]
MSATDVSQTQRTLTRKEHYAKQLVYTLLAHVKDACISLVDEQGQTLQCGDPQASLHASVLVHDPRFYTRMLTGGSIAAAEAYVDGWWESPNLTDVIRVFARNLHAIDRIEKHTGWLVNLGNKLAHWRNRNEKDTARRNISAHYDLGNDLYRHFLDEQMLYSSAIYTENTAGLEAAQIEKMDRLCRQLKLKPSDHLIEIGSGWGAMAIYAAKEYGCRVTTTTISEEQYAWAKARIEQAGLQNQITLLKEDYRDLDGEYDKLVSIEMIEAVGKEYLDTFVKKCQSLLKPEGLMAIQAITIADQRYEHYSRNVDFIQKHIFPGGFLPSVNVLLDHFTAQTDFVIRDLKDIGIDYANTLADWHQRFNQNADTLQTFGYDERFARLWRYYFCYCEGGFRERTISAVQLLFSRPAWREA